MEKKKKEEKKTLDEFIAGVPDDQIVKIGCKNGSSFVVVCKKIDFQEEIKVANSEQKGMLRKNEYNAQNALRHLLNDDFPTMKAFASDLIKMQEDDVSEFSFSGYMRFCNDWLRNVYLAQARVDNATKARNDFRPFEDRQVLETYFSDPIIGNELIIMVEGAGNGRYWDYSEAQADKKKRRAYECDTCADETQEEGE